MPSPASSSTTSPSTRSSAEISRSRPSLRTRQVVLAASCRSRSKALSLLYSDKVEISEAARMAKAMPAVSNQPSPRNKNRRLTAKAANRILIMGSFRLDSSFERKLVRFFGESPFPSPCFSNFSASSCRRPKVRSVCCISSLPVADLYKPMRWEDKV